LRRLPFSCPPEAGVDAGAGADAGGRAGAKPKSIRGVA
jgi:hypothetical protein